MNSVGAYVTGSSGFIGQHLMYRLGEDVIQIAHDEIFDWDYCDVRNFFYLASYGNMAEHKDIFEMLHANIASPGRVVGGILKKEFECEHFIYVSSSSVSLPIQTPYSRAKRAAEEMILATGVSATIVRPFSVTGLHEQPQHLIPTLIRSCMEGEPMTLDPAPVHDFIDVEDVCNGLIVLAENKAQGIFELGSGLPFSNGEVCNMVEGVCRKPANVTLSESKLREYDNTAWFCRDFNARHYLWLPKKTLLQSITEMVEEYKRAK